MGRMTLRRWLGACLLGLSAAGCHRCATCAQGTDCPSCATAMAQPAAPAACPRPAPPNTGFATQAPPALSASPYATHMAAPPPAPTFLAAQRPAGAEQTAEPPAVPLPVIRTGPVEGHSPFPRNEPPPPRRSFADVTAATCFAHAPDYGWLRGRVEYSRLSKGWRLRYASVDEADRYGGSVTLADSARLGGLKDGDYVEVRGRLSDPAAEGPAPVYQVEALAQAPRFHAAEQPAHAE